MRGGGVDGVDVGGVVVVVVDDDDTADLTPGLGAAAAAGVVVDETLPFLFVDAMTPPTIPTIATIDNREPRMHPRKKLLRFDVAASYRRVVSLGTGSSTG